MTRQSRSERRASVARGSFENFAFKGCAQLTMRDVAHDVQLAYATVYDTFTSKADLVHTIDAALAGWTVDELTPPLGKGVEQGPGAEPDPIKRMQTWFRSRERFVVAQAFWLSDRAREECKRYEDERSVDIGALMDGISSAVSSAIGVSFQRARLLLDELHSLALRRFFNDGFPSIVSRENEWRAILEGPELPIGRDATSHRADAKQLWTYFSRPRRGRRVERRL